MMMIAYALVCLVPLAAYIGTTTASECHTIETDLVLSKEKSVEYGGRTRNLLCFGTVKVNKCEGMCDSQVQPSVVQRTGFKKVCQCCSEGGFKNRLVRLSTCMDGSRQVRDQQAVFVLKEPSDCQCRDCAI